MAEWIQSAFVGILVSYMLARLFSIDNLPSDSAEPERKFLDSSFPQSHIISSDDEDDNIDHGDDDADSNGDDDWEGVERTALDETFSAASTFMSATAVSHSVSNDIQLRLYGLYKIATEGLCSSPRPSALQMTARAKWHAWRKLGTMPPEEAMETYIGIVSELYPSWAAASGSAIKKQTERSGDASVVGSKGPMGPVYSSFIFEEEEEEESEREFKMDDIHAVAREGDDIHSVAREGDEEKFLKCIESGVDLNLKDSEGRTPLHWAVDGGHMKITALLLNKNADVNAKVKLHYTELLVKHGADIKMTDSEGHAPRDLCEFCTALVGASS